MPQTINCHSCGAANQLPEGKNSMFCAFCGNTIQNISINSNFRKPNISKSELSPSFIDNEVRGRKLAYIKRNIETINEVVELYSDSELSQIIELDLSNNSITSLDGIERFCLSKLNLSGNLITTIDKLPEFQSIRQSYETKLHVEYDFSNNQSLTNFSNEVIRQIENPSTSLISKFVINFTGCLKLDIVQLSTINFSKYKRDKYGYATVFVIIDSTLEFPISLRDKGFEKSNNPHLRDYKNAWEYPKKQPITPSQKDSGTGKCFIATATMGSYEHPTVMELRYFRDNWILEKFWGESFVNWYYHYGAIAAKFIEKSFMLKKISYLLIVKPLYILSKILKK